MEHNNQNLSDITYLSELIPHLLFNYVTFDSLIVSNNLILKRCGINSRIDLCSLSFHKSSAH